MKNTLERFCQKISLGLFIFFFCLSLFSKDFQRIEYLYFIRNDSKQEKRNECCSLMNVRILIALIDKLVASFRRYIKAGTQLIH